MESIEKELRAFLSENFIFAKNGDYTDDSPFLEMGILDSTGMLELLDFLEKRYRIVFDDAELIPEYLGSISAVARCVRRKLAEQDLVAEVTAEQVSSSSMTGECD